MRPGLQRCLWKLALRLNLVLQVFKGLARIAANLGQRPASCERQVYYFSHVKRGDCRDRIPFLNLEWDRLFGSHQAHRLRLPPFRNVNPYFDLGQWQIILPHPSHDGIFEAHIG